MAAATWLTADVGQGQQSATDLNEPAMHKIALIVSRADNFCARLNDGLAAVAIVLAILTGALSTLRGAEMGVPNEAEWSLADGMN